MNNDTDAVYGVYPCHLRVLRRHLPDPFLGSTDTGCSWDGPVPSSTAGSDSSLPGSPAPKPEPARAPQVVKLVMSGFFGHARSLVCPNFSDTSAANCPGFSDTTVRVFRTGCPDFSDRVLFFSS
jgi:hypothetical protein